MDGCIGFDVGIDLSADGSLVISAAAAAVLDVESSLAKDLLVAVVDDSLAVSVALTAEYSLVTRLHRSWRQY